VPLVIDKAWINELASEMPELPETKRQRYVTELKLAPDDAYVLVESKEMSDFFDRTIKLGATAKETANWLIGSIQAYINEQKVEFNKLPLTPENMRDLAAAVARGTISNTAAKQVLAELLTKKSEVAALIEKLGLTQISNEDDLRKAVSEVLAANPGQVEEFRQGRTKVRQFFFGEIMKATKGKANPQVINKLLDELLSVAKV
jgi:aspartyl-tRNA(Asn)/glutamyl-tRNA(Gln) amidotransferase subunit B